MKFKNKKITYYIFTIICLFVCIFSTQKIIFQIIDKTHNEKLQKQALKNVSEKSSQVEKIKIINPPQNKDNDYWNYINQDMLNVDFSELSKTNSDTIGWIKLNGSNIDYPVVQTTNNHYYLNHSYDKSKNSAGWIFADYRNNMDEFDNNTIIYGHGRLDNTMFGSLKLVLNPDWYNNKDNYIVKFSNKKYNTLWQIFSVYSIKAEDYYITTNFKSENTYEEFLNVIKNRSIKDFNTSLNNTDKILTLSTCKDIAGKERVVLHAKLIKIEDNN